MKIGSLCSGYEGIGMAVQSVLGGELAWVADIDEGASAILAHRFPSVPNLGDITAVEWSTVEPVDILCAGTPCQDVSQAGARAGLKAGTRSGVWLEAVKAIAVLRPRLVLIENVRGLLSARGDDPTDEHLRAEAARDVTVRLLGWLENEQAIALAKGDVRRVRECRKRTARVMGLRKRAVARCQWHERRLVRAIGTVLGSLASLGFDAEGVVVSAAEAGAPHQRDRVFILAWPAADTRGGELQRRGIAGVLGSAAAGELGEGDQRERAGNAAGDSRSAVAADAAGPRRGGSQDARANHGDEVSRLRGVEPERGGRASAEDADRAASGEWRQPAPGQAPGGRPGRQGGQGEQFGLRPAEHQPGDIAWGPYELAIRRWERTIGRPAPRPTEPGRTGERLSPRFVEWLMGLPEGWVTDVPGLSRNAQLRALGNGVVPAQAAMALRLLLERSGLLPLVAADLTSTEEGEAA